MPSLHDILQIIIKEMGQKQYLAWKSEGRQQYYTLNPKPREQTPSKYWQMYVLHEYRRLKMAELP